MLQGFFVTGTDTNVGKTVVAAALMHRLRGPRRPRYWKPVQTGIEQDDDTAVVRLLGSCAEAELLNEGVRLPRPLSPHLSARLAGQRIELEPLARLIAAQPETSGWVVEGAGGALVPLNETQLMTDLMARLGLPVVVTARSGLGTINHTLLTLEALRRRALPVAGVVMVGEPDRENRAAIERFGEVPVLGEMPRFARLTPEELGCWARAELDPSGLLTKFLHD
ncbi:MAG TPA: dethiobiotin synthase [Blastocatellia bacterium]|nr:dethiobiotin synthase [Blastocatellia bacterium]